ncbi:MAG: PAS domain-containing protein [Rhodospirillales bacterium]|jgi:hypothetical protein|nr:PAS domain-containing protein [Rhodospirillales bacterium]MBT4628427.1 PAS domain-containing protein [Rhodospirillales bacterium]MBT5350378.1 PAS domain-containing protein [Rhodospirillales bacterium]MBT5519169.1 PAS domain-containing protein [Rhodospirillales bacterium]MBT6826804.1 PAS domain-containing protein [Rhodospirillales bacterium]
MDKNNSDATDTTIVTIDPIDLSHKRMKAFHTYWIDTHHENGDLPGLHDFDLMEIYELAPWVAIVDVVPGEAPATQFRWRFIGTHLCDALFMTNLTGHYMHNLDPANWTEEIKSCYEDIVSTAVPHMWHRRELIHAGSDETISYTRLLLPVSGEGGGVGHLAGIYVQDEPDDEP